MEFQAERQDVTIESIVEEVEKMISEENLNPEGTDPASSDIKNGEEVLNNMMHAFELV